VTFLLGETTEETRYRFLAGIGILSLIGTCLIFSICQMDALVADQIRLNAPLESLHQDNQGATIPAGRLAASGSNSLVPDPLTLAVHRGRAYLIAGANVAAVLALLYSYAVIRHILRNQNSSSKPVEDRATVEG
jgi:hypothetical protein